MEWTVRKKKEVPLAWIAAGWVAVVAALAGVGWVGLRHWHDRAAHQAAAQAVAEQGQWLTMSLALRAGEAAEGRGGGWRAFAGLVDSLREVEQELEFVAVRRDGVTLFQEHGATAAVAESGAGKSGVHFAEPVRMGRRRLANPEAGAHGDGGEMPVVTFTATVATDGKEASPVEVEAGFALDAVEREEWAAVRAIDSMYRLGLLTVGAAFAICLALVAWMAHREERRERARRREEHLAFSGMLANGIVHDFRNPMSSLRLDAQMLEKETAKGAGARMERMGELAGRMRHTMDRMDKIFCEFSTLARPEATADGGRRLPVDLAACVRECAEMMVPRFEAAGVTLEGIPSEGMPVMMMGAAAGVKRAILNVLLNALQHAKAPGPVRMRLETMDGAGAGKVALEVEDNGEGIPPALREKVFELFYTTRPQGTGLGLFLARLAVEHSGGMLRALPPRAASGARLRMEFDRAMPAVGVSTTPAPTSTENP